MAELELDDYSVNLMDMIGHGGFGIVYGGKKITTGEKVAVKMIKIVTEEDGCDAMREIKLFDRLKEHPNLIRLLDFHYMNHAFWMIMDFCDGGDLDRYMYETNPDLAEQLRLMYQCASAIAHMHQSKPPMIHRDIKPANVLMFKKGKFILERWLSNIFAGGYTNDAAIGVIRNNCVLFIVVIIMLTMMIMIMMTTMVMLIIINHFRYNLHSYIFK